VGPARPGNCAARHLRAARPAPRPAAPAPQTVKLQLVPTGQVHVCLVDGSGKILIHGKIFAASHTIPAQRASKLLLTLGNASMQMKVNGRQVTVPPSATSIGFLLGPTGYRPLPVSKQPLHRARAPAS